MNTVVALVLLRPPAAEALKAEVVSPVVVRAVEVARGVVDELPAVVVVEALVPVAVLLVAAADVEGGTAMAAAPKARVNLLPHTPSPNLANSP